MSYLFGGLSSAGAMLVAATVMWLAKTIRSHAKDHEQTSNRLDRIEQEFYPNGGRSVWDRLDATYEMVAQLARDNGHRPTAAPRKEKP